MTTHPSEDVSTFGAVFLPGGVAVPVVVPDYQRAYSWELKQIDLFVADLQKYCGGSGYYFGHFIVEGGQERWELVDGQQRLTTFVLFLLVCRELSPQPPDHPAYSLIQAFRTVSYDSEAFGHLSRHLGMFLEKCGRFDPKRPPSDEKIIEWLGLADNFTRSQKRMIVAVLRFQQAFERDELQRESIPAYLEVIMGAQCSLHLTRDKSVAVNIFEMHNTRGVPLSTLEIIKAKLMQFVHDHGGETRDAMVEAVQAEFGEIYGMEERLATRSFRGEMTVEALLRLHLRAVDDGEKSNRAEFRYPALNANAEDLVAYVESKLLYVDKERGVARDPEDGVRYAVELAREFKKSVRIMSEYLPAWDADEPLVGDVLILERELSCQFFLILCRRLEMEPGTTNGRASGLLLEKWERLLFTRDFHSQYYNLKGGRDDFPSLFAACTGDEEAIMRVIEGYLADGFRRDRTSGLQSIVAAFVKDNRERILNEAFHWWKPKMIYAIYKYEAAQGASIREVLQGTISVEHILPQQWDWIREENEYLRDPEGGWESFRREIDTCINGIGNLLLITPGENTAEGNKHPADKRYPKYSGGGTYAKHHADAEQWRDPKQWAGLIQTRGEAILEFLEESLLDVSAVGDHAEP